MIFAGFLYGVGRFWTMGQPIERDWVNIGFTIQSCGHAFRWVGLRLAIVASALLLVSFIALAT